MAADRGHEGSSGFTSRDRELAKLLGAGLTYAEAGEKLGVSLSTVKRAARQPGFAELVESERSSHTETIVERLTVLSRRALDRLEKVLTDDDESTANQLKAAGMALAELGRRTVPTTVQMSGSLALDIESMTAEQVQAELERVGTEIAKLTGHAIEPGEGGTPTEHVWDLDDVPAGAAESRSEPVEPPDDQSPTEPAETAAEPQEASEDSDSGDLVPEPEPEPPEEDAPENVVPMRPGWQPDPSRMPNPWRGTDPAATSLYPW